MATKEKKSFKKFLIEMFSGVDGGVSSKRVLGSLILFILTVAITINIFCGANNHWLGDAIDTLIITSGALVGLGIADKAFDGIVTRNRSKDTDENNGENQ